MEQRCDQIVDCRDKSDEDNCKLIVFEDNYNREEIFIYVYKNYLPNPGKCLPSP